MKNPSTVSDRAETLFEEHQRSVFRQSDRVFAVLMTVQWLAGIGLALFYSPTAWNGRGPEVHLHVWAALFLGGAISGVPVLLAITRPASPVTRHAVAAGQMLTSALLIHLAGGRLEVHFHVFGSLAFLAFYRDWRVILTATTVVALDHFFRGLFWPESVYGVALGSEWRWLEHAFWVVFEDVILVFWCVRGLREMRDISLRQAKLEDAQQQIVDKQRLEQEMRIASTIQTSILPRKLDIDGLEIAARMVPASEVGGDYYDVLPVEDGCWVGIGDVSGHGLNAGMMMLMIQSAVAGLGRQAPDAQPRQVLGVLNELLFDNIRNRLEDDNHATLTLLRYRDDGSLSFAGAHEDIVFLRPGQPCEVVTTPGPWVGAVHDIRKVTVDTQQQLGPGDLMVLYTDGVTEAMNASGEQFGIERLCAEIEAARDLPVEQIRDRLVDAVARFGVRQDDDVTVVVIRRSVSAAAARAA